MYADFKSALGECYEVVGDKTISYQRHVPVSFSVKFCSEVPELRFKPIYYAGKDAAKVFVSKIRQVARKINELFPDPMPMKRTKEEQEKWEKETRCFACGKEFVPGDKNLKKVFDHDHYTGAYRSAMHSQCNFQCQDRKTFPIFLHNFSGYDSHLLLKELNAFDDGEVKCLLRNEEKCISIMKKFHVSNHYDYQGVWRKKFVTFEFKDSFLFLSSSLENLAKSLGKEDFAPLAIRFGKEWELLTGKQVFPNRFLRGMESLSHEGFVPIEEFGSRLGEGELFEGNNEILKRCRGVTNFPRGLRLLQKSDDHVWLQDVWRLCAPLLHIGR